MRRVPVEKLEAGMIVGRTVFGADGRPLLTQNMQLSDKFILKFKSLGISSVYIKDGLTDIEIPEMVSSKVLTEVSSNLKNSMLNLSSKKSVNINTLKKSVALLIEDIISNRHVLVQLEDIHSYDDYLFFHSINVAVFSIMTGLSMGYHEGDIMDLGLGALLHDIGMIMIDSQLLNKPEPLAKHEMEEVKRHPEIGFNILRNFREVSATAAHVAYQHHERFNGSGYPRKLVRKQILEYAQISAVADTFDAIITDHPYRKAYTTTEGVIIIKKLADSHFNPDIVDAFVSNIAIYPVGSMVMLNTGHIAVVSSVSRYDPENPVIHVICDQKGNLVKNVFSINLRDTNEVVISKRLSQEETDLIYDKVNKNRYIHNQSPHTAVI